MNILIGEITSYKAIVIAKYIKQTYPESIIFTYDYRNYTRIFRTKFSDKHFLIKKNDINNFKLKEIIIKYNIEFFFPVINNEIKKIWKHKNDYGESLKYLGAYENYKILNDKYKLHKLAKRLDILTPKIYDNLKEVIFPFVVKPTNLSSAKGILYINTKNDINKISNQRNLILQEFITGVGVGYSCYCYNGQISNGYGHMRLAEYPITGGSSTYRTNYIDERMENVVNKIINNINYTGFAMFEFKLTKNNKLFLIECNPRIWGSINQGLVNGVNYFEKILYHKKNSKIKFKYKTYLSPLIYLSFFKYLLSFRINHIYIFLKNIKINKSDVSFLNDTKAYISMILRKL